MRKLEAGCSGDFTVFHGTDKLFGQFSLDYAARPNMSGNGHLGVWLAVHSALAKRFGEHCLEVAIKVDKAYVMAIDELARLNQMCLRKTLAAPDEATMRELERQFYSGYREQKLAEGYDTLYLAESDGRVDMVIAMQPARLKIR